MYKDADIVITLTMRPPKNPKKTKMSIWEKQHTLFSKYFREITGTSLKYCLRVYELTLKGYLHCHCIAKANGDVKSVIKRLNMVAECYGFYQRDIFFMKNYDNWFKYCFKDIEETKELLKEYPISVVHVYKPMLVHTEKELKPSPEWIKQVCTALDESDITLSMYNKNI